MVWIARQQGLNGKATLVSTVVRGLRDATGDSIRGWVIGVALRQTEVGNTVTEQRQQTSAGLPGGDARDRPATQNVLHDSIPVMEVPYLVGIGRVEDEGTVNRCYTVITCTNNVGIGLQHRSQCLRPGEVEVEGELPGFLDVRNLEAV